MKAQLEVTCHKRNLAVIRTFVRDWLEPRVLEGPVVNQIVLAVDEASANCMIHQHQCDDYSTIEVSIYREEQTLYTEIKDTGKAFPIDQYEPTELDDIVKSKLLANAE